MSKQTSGKRSRYGTSIALPMAKNKAAGKAKSNGFCLFRFVWIGFCFGKCISRENENTSESRNREEGQRVNY